MKGRNDSRDVSYFLAESLLADDERTSGDGDIRASVRILREKGVPDEMIERFLNVALTKEDG